MLEVFVNFICAFLLAITGFYIIKKTINSNQKLDIKTIIILIINAAVVDLIHYTGYQMSSLLTFITNIITYKFTFKITIESAIISTGILFIFILFADIINLFIQIAVIPLSTAENNIFVYLASNIIVIIISLLLISIKKIQRSINNFYVVLLKKELKLNIIFIFLIIIAASGIAYNVITNYRITLKLFGDVAVIESLLVIVVIFIRNMDNYDKLSKEYDLLLANVQNFENWIEKEQYARHEYKNQLAVLYAISNESKVKNKIQEIIDQNLNIESKVVNNISQLPKGPIKGILYYKTLIAQNEKIEVIIDISLKSKSIINKLNDQQKNTIAKLIGIYYDNAIEASYNSTKKKILIEIYELKNAMNLVISNTYKKENIIDNMTKKGASSKGLGRGNGLYFAQKILNKNTWLIEKQEIIDNYYVETLTIRKNTSKK